MNWTLEIEMKGDKSPQPVNRELQLKFGGKATEGNVVPVVVLAKSLQSLQRAVHILGMCHEGKEVRRRVRVPAEIEKRYRILCRLPEEGSYIAPLIIEDTSQNLTESAAGAVTGGFHDLLSGIEAQDSSLICSVLPDPNYRTLFFEALLNMTPPTKSGIDIALQSRTGDDLYVPNKDASFLKNIIKGHIDVDKDTFADTLYRIVRIETATITGRLIGIDFDSRCLRLFYHPTKRELQCHYRPEVEEMLLINARELIQVVGRTEIDVNGDPKRIHEVEKIIEVDLSNIEIDSFEVGGKRIIAKQPVTFKPMLDNTYQHFTLQDSLFGIQLLAGGREELKIDIYDELDLLWRQYAEERDEMLNDDALKLKNQLLEAFGVAR